ncbi:MAG: MFS transporter, partial [Rubrobacter sp.]
EACLACTRWQPRHSSPRSSPSPTSLSATSPSPSRTRQSSARGYPSYDSQLVRILKISDLRALLVAALLLNLSFAGLVSNFPLFSHVRFGWGTTANAFFFAFVGVCAVVTQGFLVGRLQPRFGERRLLIGGLALVSPGLVLVALVPLGALLYPVVGLLALGTGLAIPSLTAVISNRTPAEAQGRLMGGLQAILSLALILGPVLAGGAFDYVGVPAPYLLGGALALLALIVARIDLLRQKGEYA